MKLIRNKIGAIGLGTLISVVGGVAVGVFTAVNYVNQEIASAVNPVQAEVSQQQTAIVAVQTDVSWIKASLQAKGFHPANDTTTP